MSWDTVKIGDVVKLQRGHDLTSEQRKDGIVPVIGSAGQNGFHDVSKSIGPGFTVGRSGASIGKVTFVPVDYWPHNTCLYAKDLKNNNPRFLAYQFSTLNLAQLNSGSAQPSLNRNFVHSVKIRFPKRHIQDQIASVLSAYDDLIENNRRRIALLEESARLLYREWFVHLRFPRHETTKIIDGVPQGWERKNLFEISDVLYGYSFKSKQFNESNEGLPVVRIRDIPRGYSKTYTLENAPSEKLLSDGDFLIGMDGEFHQNYWVGGTAWINQRVVRISPKDSLTIGFLREALRQPIEHFNQTIAGTTVAHLGAKHLKIIDILIPDIFLLNKVNKIFDDARRQIVALSKQNSSLVKARDHLLPRLMDGRVKL